MPAFKRNRLVSPSAAPTTQEASYIHSAIRALAHIGLTAIFSSIRLLGRSAETIISPSTVCTALGFLLVTHVTIGGEGAVGLLPRFLSEPYCRNIGIGCAGRSTNSVAGLAHAVAEQAAQTADMFGSVIALARGQVFDLDFHKPLAASVAVRTLPCPLSKTAVGNHLAEFAYQTRDVGDLIAGINARGLSLFAWTHYRFERIERLIVRAQGGHFVLLTSTGHDAMATILRHGSYFPRFGGLLPAAGV